MKMLKHAAVVVLLIVASYFITKQIPKEEPTPPLLIAMALVIVVVLIVNIVLRKSLFFKPYFTSPFNVLATRSKSEKTYDIQKELMYEKVKEVINDSKFSLVDFDDDKLELLAITKITFRSWGENVYISFESMGDETVMKCVSTALMQAYAWGKNEKNCDDLIHEIEESLIV